MFEVFRNEIIEAEKERTDLLKWKLIVVAGLGGIGFGFFSNATGNGAGNPQGNETSHLALSIIPLACLYIDLICYNLQVRMIIIGLFIQNYRTSNGGNDSEGYCMYEKFCDNNRGAFKLEDWAMEYSTRFISGFIMLSTIPIIQQHNVMLKPFSNAGIYVIIILFAGLTGITLSVVIKKKFNKIIHKIQKTIHHNMKEACRSCNAAKSIIGLNPS
jgi:hypothetical protein